MTLLEVCAQILGIVGMVLAILSFQQKTQKKILTFQVSSNALFIINYLLLGALTGGFLHLCSLIRGVVFSFRNKHSWAASILWIFIFSSLYLISYMLVFVVFNVEFNLYNATIEMLPVIGSVMATIGFRMKNANMVRFMYLFAAPPWVVYSVLNFNIGGSLSEFLNMVSIIIGIIRLDRKKKIHSFENAQIVKPTETTQTTNTNN